MCRRGDCCNHIACSVLVNDDSVFLQLLLNEDDLFSALGYWYVWVGVDRGVVIGTCGEVWIEVWVLVRVGRCGYRCGYW